MSVVDFVPKGTFFSNDVDDGDRKGQAQKLVTLGQVEIDKGLNLALSDNPEILWAHFRAHVRSTVSADLFGYQVSAFIIDHDQCVNALKEKFYGMSNSMEAMRYWVFNSPAPAVENPSIAISDEVQEDLITLPLIHEAFENAIALGGVRIDGVPVPKGGSCRIAAKLEISRALGMLETHELIDYLKTREHMFKNAGESEEFNGSLNLIREVLEILER
jgi:hypothetical protein